MNNKEKHPDFPNLWIAILILILSIGVQILFGALFYDFGLFADNWDLVGYVTVVLSTGLLISLLMSYKGLTYRAVFNPGSTPFSAMATLVLPATLVVVSGSFAVGVVTDLIVEIFPPSQEEIEMFTSLLGDGLLSFVLVVLIAPVIEEIVFRGLLLRSFLHNYSPKRAIIYSALLFGMYHLNIYQVPGAFIFGLFAGWLYLRTQSLWPSLIAHAIVNATALILITVYGEESILQTPEELASPMITVVAVLGLLIGLIWMNSALRNMSAVSHLDSSDR